MKELEDLASFVGWKKASSALGIPRATFLRWRKGRGQEVPRAPPPWTLSDEQKKLVEEAIYQDRFVDLAAAEIYATLLDEGTYLCSLRTMQRILSKKGTLKERRAQRRHPLYQKPELLATGPNQVWSWDITKIRGPQKGVWYQLYVVMDIFSRSVVGWQLATHESEHLAALMLEKSFQQQGVLSNQLCIHADRGPSMRSRTVAELLERLEVRKSHSRPYTSDDNPYSESGFKTMRSS